MKEIVERILKEERLAQDRIERSRKESEQTIQKARKEAQDAIARSVDETMAEAQRKKLESQQEFVREKEAVLKKTKDDVAASIGDISKDISMISQKIFTRIVTIEE